MGFVEAHTHGGTAVLARARNGLDSSLLAYVGCSSA